MRCARSQCCASLSLGSEQQERITTVMMWFWTVAVGVVVAVMAFFMIYAIGQISLLKFQLVMCMLPHVTLSRALAESNSIS